MTRRFFPPVAALVLAAALSGCTGNQQLEAELHRFRDSSKSQLDLLKKQNELLNRKLNDMNETVDEFADTGDRLSTELATYVNRPEEVKLEIITEVNNRFIGIATGQEEFKKEVNELFDAETKVIKEDVVTSVDEMEKTLEQHISFVQFVATQQDSINRVFANRFDSRPWYESVLGKWDDMERRKQEAPLMRRAAWLALTPLLLAAAGCGADRELEVAFIDVKNHNREQLLLLESQSEFLTHKMNRVTDKVEAARGNENRLSAQLAAYINRPDAIKREILSSLQAQADSLAANQVMFREDLAVRLGARNREVADNLAAELGAMQAALDYQNGFMQFVATEQDSLNRAFAMRFDTKPWYKSVIGTWEAKQAKAGGR